METKMIKIIDGAYNEKFKVPDGGHIMVNGKIYPIQYVDETHFRISGRCFHIHEFGRKVIDRGQDVQPYN